MPGGMLRSLHIFTLVSLAVAQPIFNLASLEPMVLVSHAARPLDVLALPLALGLLLPLIVLSVEWLAGLLEARLAWFVHLAIVAALARCLRPDDSRALGRVFLSRSRAER